MMYISACMPVILEEDTNMSGFVPLLSTPLNNTFVHSSVDQVSIINVGKILTLKVSWLI